MFPVVAVDLGGTHLRAAYFPSRAWAPARRIRRKTRAAQGPEAVIGRLALAIQGLLPEETHTCRIGVACPGPLDPREGVVLNAVNLPGWRGIPLGKILKERFGLAVTLQNDAKAAAVGEWRRGAGMGVDDLIYLTVSTGIGGGVISGGNLLLGARGLASELGHMTVLPGGARCSCGQQGHIEAYAAGPAIARQALDRLESWEGATRLTHPAGGVPLSAEAVGAAARQGDRLALSVLEDAAGRLGGHLASLVHAFNPSRIILGGGVTEIGDPFLVPLRKGLEANLMHPGYREEMEVVTAALGDDAGLVGMVVLAREH